MFRLLAIVYCIYAATAATVNIGKNRIIGGEAISIKDVPYQVSIIDMTIDLHTCGGSIISEDYVLTAAHCVEDLLPAELKIRSGTSGVYNSEEGSRHYVTKIIQHEGYDMDFEGIPINDIALLKVSPPFYLNGKTTDKIGLFEQGEEAEVGDEALLTGWGETEDEDEAEKLQSLKVEIIDTKTCFNNYITLGGIKEKQICATYLKGGKDMCNGDSGGPLVIDGKQVGVVSWSGPGCAQPRRPGVYTEVAAYRDWIEEHID